VIASHEDHYLVLHVHVLLLTRRDVAMSYEEQLNNTSELAPR
jgi:hypothetical protein